MLDAVLVEPVDGVDVTQTSEGARRCLERGVERFDESGGGWVGKENINGSANLRAITYKFEVEAVGEDKTYNVLDMRHEIVEFDERKFSFQVGIFAQMTSRVTIAEPRALRFSNKTKNTATRRTCSLHGNSPAHKRRRPSWANKSPNIIENFA